MNAVDTLLTKPHTVFSASRRDLCEVKQTSDVATDNFYMLFPVVLGTSLVGVNELVTL